MMQIPEFAIRSATTLMRETGFFSFSLPFIGKQGKQQCLKIQFVTLQIEKRQIIGEAFVLPFSYICNHV